MDDTLNQDRKKRGFDRFLGFTDAVVSIAVTLLILPVVDAVTQSSSQGMSVTDLLEESQGEIFGFLLSFAVIIVLWLAHQQVFEIAGSFNPWLMRLGVLWLLSITLLPFTTALIADHAGEQTTVLLYVGNVAVSIYCLGASTWILSRHSDLLMTGATITATDLFEMKLNCGLVTIAFIVALRVPAANLSVMALMLLDDPIHFLWKRLWPRRSTTECTVIKRGIPHSPPDVEFCAVYFDNRLITEFDARNRQIFI